MIEKANGALKRSDRHATWPGGVDGSRIWKDCQPSIRPSFELSDQNSFFAIGSCFARNIEQYLGRKGLNVLSQGIAFPSSELLANSRNNDLLVKYTPGSIHQELTTAFNDSPIGDEEYAVEASSGKYFDVNLPMYMPPVSLERCIERRRQVRELFRDIRAADCVFLTLGLIEHWRDEKLGIFINGTPHPRAAAREPERFRPVVLGYADNLELVKKSIDLMIDARRDIKIVITTSPVPLQKTFTDQDVLVANMYSKSVLRVVAQDIASQYKHVDYLPSYESVMLSDPKASWHPDLRHVLDSKVGDIISFFFKSYFRSATSAAEQAFLAGRRAWEARNFEEAFREYSKIDDVYARDESFMLTFLELAHRLKKTDDVMRISAAVVARFPDRARPYMVRAQTATQLGEYADAIACLDVALRVRPRTLLQVCAQKMLIARASEQQQIAVDAALALEKANPNMSYDLPAPAWLRASALRVLKKSELTDACRAVHRFFVLQDERTRPGSGSPGQRIRQT